MTLGEKIKTYRKNMGLSQETLAEKLLVSRQAITKWENDLGIPDVNNLKNIGKLFGVSVDCLLDNDISETQQVMKEEINLKDYSSSGLLKERHAAVVKAKYPDADAIYPLAREKKLSKIEKILDFFIGAGTLEVVDVLNNLDFYFLVEKGNKQLLVRVSKTFIESKVLSVKFEGNKSVIDGNIFTKGARI